MVQGMEATMYALIMSVNNLGGVVGSQFGAAITVSLVSCLVHVCAQSFSCAMNILKLSEICALPIVMKGIRWCVLYRRVVSETYDPQSALSATLKELGIPWR